MMVIVVSNPMTVLVVGHCGFLINEVLIKGLIKITPPLPIYIDLINIYYVIKYMVIDMLYSFCQISFIFVYAFFFGILID